MSQIIMMAAILDRDRDTASGATDAPHLPAAARNVRGPGRASNVPATTLYAKSGWKV